MIIALILSLIVLVLQDVISWLAFFLLDGSSEVERLAKEYYDIRIWGTFASLGNYALLGWLYGIQKPKLALALRVIMNLLNIPLAIFLALNLGLGVKGTALSAISSNYVVLLMGIGFAIFYINQLVHKKILVFDNDFFRELKDPEQLFRIFKINRDIFIRTIFVFLVFSWFTALGAKQGDLILAANAVLINLYWFISYALDSCSNAAETLVGQSIGAKNPKMFFDSIRLTSLFAIVFALILTLIYFLFGDFFISCLTTNIEIKNKAMEYLPWLIFMPVVAVWCFQLDGIFFGSTETKPMRNMMLLAFLLFVISILTLPKAMGNNGLWLSLYVFMIARAVTLWAPFRALKEKLFRA
jgi:MATE family multidrug resistance protein